MGSAFIAATSDIHSPKYLSEFRASLERTSKACLETNLFILAGDIVERGNISAARWVFDAIEKYCSPKKVIAVFGNEEYIGFEEKFKQTYRSITWLDDNATIVEIRGMRIGVYGTRGVLDRPTRWQRKNLPFIWRVYRERLNRIKAGLENLRNQVDCIIFVSHYVPSYKLLKGEPIYAWPEMGSNEVERILLSLKPNLVIYGHAHNAIIKEAEIEGVKFLNVAFPLRRSIVYINDLCKIYREKQKQ